MSDQFIYTLLAILATVAMALGYTLSYIRSRNQMDELKQKYAELNAKLDKERTVATRKFSNMEKVRSGIEQTFSSLVDQPGEVEQAISSQGDHVKALMKPLQLTLQETDKQVRHITNESEKSRHFLDQHIALLKQPAKMGRGGTREVVEMFGEESERARWGVTTLNELLSRTETRRYCLTCNTPNDADNELDTSLPPPAVIAMPGDEIIAIDANLPLEPYIDLCTAPDQSVRTWHGESHARKLRERIREMASRAYQSQFNHAPALTILLVANDHYIASALESDESLLRDSINEKIILATPADIFTLLQTLSIVWREKHFAQDATKIRETGLNMYKRFGVFAQLLSQLGSELSGVLHSYNQAVTFFEGKEEPKEPPPTAAANAGSEAGQGEKTP